MGPILSVQPGGHKKKEIRLLPEQDIWLYFELKFIYRTNYLFNTVQVKQT